METLDAKEHARALVRMILDSGGETVLDVPQRLLLARYAKALATPTPDDVARDAEAVGAALAKARKAAGMSADARTAVREVEAAHAALDRLSDGAARAKVLADGRDHNGRELSKASAMLTRAEADLAAARQEVEGFRQQAMDRADDCAAACRERDELSARVTTLERALAAEVGAEQGSTAAGWRDAAARADALAAQAVQESEEWKARADAAEARESEMRKKLAEEEARNKARAEREQAIARQRVARLLFIARWHRFAAGEARSGWSRRFDREEEGRLAAEAREAETRRTLEREREEEQKRADSWMVRALDLAALVGMYNSVVQDLPERHQKPFAAAGVAVVGCHLLNNEPPVPLRMKTEAMERYCKVLAQYRPSGVSGSALAVLPTPPAPAPTRDPRQADDGEPLSGEDLDLVDEGMRRLGFPPAPAPLVEASRSPATVRSALEACPCDSSEPCETCCALLDELDAMTAAHDAAKVGDAEFQGGPEHVCGAENDECPKCSRPGEEPVITHAALAAVVEAYMREVLGGLKDGMDPEVTASIRGGSFGAHHVLRRATGGQVPDVAEDARKYREACERVKDARGLMAAAARADGVDPDDIPEGATDGEHYALLAGAGARWALGLTLDTPPSGPGGGERAILGEACVCGGGTWHHTELLLDGAGACSRCGKEPDYYAQSTATHHGGTEAQPREAHVEPTPEVPPMTDAEARETLASAGITPERSAAGLARGMAMVREAREKAEAAAPEVAWTGDGVRVLADGAIQDGDDDMGWEPIKSPTSAEVGLARGLVEAKRETRKAAEGMRERARGFILAAATSGKLHPAVAEALAEEIATLPTEGE